MSLSELEQLARYGRKKKKAGRPKKVDCSPETLELQRINDELDQIHREQVRRMLDGLHAYEPMPEAEKFFKSRSQFRVVRGGNQSSKTLNCAVVFAAWARGLDLFKGWAPRPKKRKGAVQLLAIGISQDHLSKVMYQKLCLPGAYFKYRFDCPDCGEHLFIFPSRKQCVLMQGEIGGNFPGYEGELRCTKCTWTCMLDEADREWRWEAPPLIPATAIKNISWQNKGLEIPGIIETEHAHVHFRTAGSGRQNFQGFQPDGVWIDEELGTEADGVWEEVSRGLMAKKSPLMWSATPLAKQAALIDLHDRASTDKDVFEIVLGLAANHHLPRKAREATIRNWPDWQRPCRVSGEFLALEGLVYGEFSQDQHVIDEKEIDARSNEWKDQFCFYRAIDPGLNVSAVLFFAVDKNEDYLIFDEIYLRGSNIEQLAHAIIDKSKGLTFVDTVIDPSDQRSLTCREGLKVVLLRDYRIPVHSRFDRDVMQGIMRVKEDLIVRPEGRSKLQVSSNCHNFIREIRRYRRGDNKGASDQSGKVVKKADHCFAAGTMILTDQGDVPIEDVRVGDMVLTREGWKPVEVAWFKTEPVDVMELELSNGRTITGTPNHKMWVADSGWTPLDALRYGDILYSEEDVLCARQSDSTADCTQDTQSLIGSLTGCISRIMASSCIERYGSTITGLYLKAASFITRTVTQAITTSPILSALTTRVTTPSTHSSLLLSTDGTWIASDLWRLSGTDLKRVASGISSTARTSGRAGSPRPSSASSAARSSSQGATERNSVRTTVNRRTGASPGPIRSKRSAQDAARCSASTSTTSPSTARVSVLGSRAASKTQVYNLTVADCHEFVAGGVLASNCMDALRYRVMAGLRYRAPYEMPQAPGSFAYQRWRKEERKRQLAKVAQRRML